MSGAQIAAEIAAAYEEAGIEAGSGTGAVLVTVVRPGAPGGDAWNPTPGTPTSHVFTAKPADKQYMQRPGAAMAEGERVYSLVNHGVAIAPTTADSLTIDGDAWAVVEVIDMDAAGYTLSWLVKVTR